MLFNIARIWPLFWAFIFVFRGAVLGAKTADEITSLPLWEKALPSKQYSGYLNIDATTFLHYWFVESENDPSTDPVVLWLNGGPGCSSLDGYFYELGPFELTTDGGLKLRPYRWNRFANMLFLEAPVGVGFSYSSEGDYVVSDDTTASDNLLAVEAFFESFSEYKSNSFYIAGESYAGIYVPTLAEAILAAVDAGTYTGADLKGIAVGNGCTGYEVGMCGWEFTGVCEGLYYNMLYLTELPFIRQSLKDSIASTCDWTYCKNNQSWYTDSVSLSDACIDLIYQVWLELGAINVYNVYGTCTFDMCDAEDGTLQSGRVGNLNGRLEQFNRLKAQVMEIKNPATTRPTTKRLKGKKSKINLPGPVLEKNSLLSASIQGDDWDDADDGDVYGPVGCIDSSLATTYLMRTDVMEAIHVQDPGYCWAVCNDVPGWEYYLTRPNLPRDTYPYLISRLRVLIYNGDWDACVPYTDNAAWTENMGLPATTSWKHWYYQDMYDSKQIGGYHVIYDTSSLDAGIGASSFEFRTVRGAGHMVPEDAPVQGLALLAHLLDVPASMYYLPSYGDDDSDDGDDTPSGRNVFLGLFVGFAVLFIQTLFFLIYYYRETKRLQASNHVDAKAVIPSMNNDDTIKDGRTGALVSTSMQDVVGFNGAEIGMTPAPTTPNYNAVPTMEGDGSS